WPTPVRLNPHGGHGREFLPFAGYTFFEYREKIESGVLYTTGKFSEMVINGGMDEIGIVTTMHHELRHMLLGDFGRTTMRAKHSQPGAPRTEADDQTDRAESEANENAKKKP
ncbi:MAG: hypothetical protein KIT57_20835, partial [Blastocatellales bacterium]|nr:hypothetical protein [Blastocatellales bacterium]